MYTVYFFLYNVEFTKYGVKFGTQYNFLCILFSIQFQKYGVKFAVYVVCGRLYIVHRSMYSAQQDSVSQGKNSIKAVSLCSPNWELSYRIQYTALLYCSSL